MEIAVITGCTRGIGYAIACRLSERYKIVGCATNPDNIQRVRERHAGWDIQLHDLRHKEEAYRFAAYIQHTYGKLSILVNNAGLFRPGNLFQEPDEVYEEMLGVHLSAAYYLTKGVLPLFIAQNRGLIVNISSIAALGAYPGGGSYAVAKAGLLAFSRNLRFQLKQYGIAVSALLVGATWTDSWRGSPYPPERFIPPEAVAEIVWTLAHLPSTAVVEELILRPMQGDI
ncbi:MAG: SDR family oxidoreductase [Bacteroidia bacterium]|nr:SDR family oxidoreductase [Bacteroidia bacterium]MDW8235482.1 SDR family oxidoreductase [Bacteroidia bacterium]